MIAVRGIRQLRLSTILWITLGVAVADWCLAWLSWAILPGNTTQPAHSGFHLGVLVWHVTSFPVALVLPKDIMTLHFETAMMANGVLWGLCIFSVLLVTRRENR